MILEFALDWLPKQQPLSKTFKLEGARSLFEDYTARLSHNVEVKYGPLKPKEAGTQLWICDIGARAKMLSSEELSKKVETLQNSGIRKWVIAIGGANGFTKEALEKLTPDFRWSFGSMTLPHELAAVVAVEQVYRAFTILHNLPYHKGH